MRRKKNKAQSWEKEYKESPILRHIVYDGKGRHRTINNSKRKKYVITEEQVRELRFES